MIEFEIDTSSLRQAIIDLANGKEVERYLLVEGDTIDSSNVEGYVPEF